MTARCRACCVPTMEPAAPASSQRCLACPACPRREDLPVTREFPRPLALPQAADGSSRARLGPGTPRTEGHFSRLPPLASERAAWPGVLLGELRTVSRAHLPVPVYAVDTTGD
jgi:hypothetical protein